MYNPFRQGDLPWWYDLELVDNTVTVGMPLEAYEYIIECVPIDRFVELLHKNFGVDNFTPAGDNYWGYNQVIATRLDKNMATLSCALPDYKDDGKQWHRAQMVALNLRHIFTCLWSWNHKASGRTHPRQQLATIEGLELPHGSDGAGLAIAISPTLRNWIATSGDDLFESITETMYQTYSTLSGKGMYRRSEFRTDCRRGPGIISLDCTDPRTGLYAETSLSDDTHQGYGLGEHNVDNTFQLLSLLCGIVKLCQIARHNIEHPNSFAPS